MNIDNSRVIFLIESYDHIPSKYYGDGSDSFITVVRNYIKDNLDELVFWILADEEKDVILDYTSEIMYNYSGDLIDDHEFWLIEPDSVKSCIVEFEKLLFEKKEEAKTFLSYIIKKKETSGLLNEKEKKVIVKLIEIFKKALEEQKGVYFLF